jgi:hypothetical protein
MMLLDQFSLCAIKGLRNLCPAICILNQFLTEEIRMRRILLTCLGIFLVSSIFSQTMNEYFREKGVTTIAEMAHPTNTFERASYLVGETDIYYEGGYHTEVEVVRQGHCFTGINLLSDNDWVSPFLMVSSIKNLALSLIKDDSDQQTMSAFEAKIDKTLQEMNGMDITCLVLTLGWLEY